MRPKETLETRLAQKRTELAQERTILSYFRTAASLILFGFAFIGFQQDSRFLFFTGLIAIVIGVIFLLAALYRGARHRKEILHFK